VNAKGQVVFFATLTRARAEEGLFLASSGRITKVALSGDAAPGGGVLSGFGKHPIPSLNEAGDVAFSATVAGGRTVEGVFVASRGRLRTIATVGDAASGLSGATLASLDAPALNDRGDVAFLATARRGRETVEAIYLRSGTALRKVVAQGTPAPAGGTFAGFGPPALNRAGVVAFAAVVEGRGVPGGVFVADRQGVRMLVGAGDDTPLGGIFAKFSERVALDNAGAIAFNAILKDAPVAGGIFLVIQGRARKVTALDDAAPGGGRFSHFGFWPALGAAGTVVFAASVDDGPSPVAIFMAGEGGIVRLAAVGDRLPGDRPLASFGLYPVAALSRPGAVTFATTPTATGEGGEGIFLVEPPRPK
jgi:hypothetical protein